MTNRTGTIWVPDWPLVVALAINNLPADTPAVITTNKRITVASGYARKAGIRTNMPVRHAQELLPNIHVLDSNPTLEAREFEYIAQLTETLIPHIDILRPGLLTFGANGPTRYYTSETALADKVVNLLATEGQVEAHVGFAEGLLASVLSARTMRTVTPEGSAEFLSGRPLSEAQAVMTTAKDRAQVRELCALWDRLGIRTFGELAALSRTKVHTRFGAAGLYIYELAHGKDLYGSTEQRTKPEVIVEHALEYPAARVDEAAFYARRLAQQMFSELVSQSATCGRMQVTAKMSDGTQLQRSWRTDDSALGAMSPERLTQRVRWQLEGWLTNSALRERARMAKERKQAQREQEVRAPGSSTSFEGRDARFDVERYGADEGAGSTGNGSRKTSQAHKGRRPDPHDEGDLRAELEAEERLAELHTAELVWMQLTALDVVGAATHQESLWGASSGSDVRAYRAAERAASLLGPQNVCAVDLVGGRTYQERIELVPWEDVPRTQRNVQGFQDLAAASSVSTTEPWPGALPSPAPTLLFIPPEPISLLAHDGTPIGFSNRLIMSGLPHLLTWQNPTKGPLDVLDWAGPWPVTTGWWRAHKQRTLYLQLVCKEHQALLVSYASGQWHCEGMYD